MSSHSIAATGGVAGGATLELTLYLSSADGLRLKPPSDATSTSALLPKSKPFVVAWVDSGSKKSTKSLLNSPRGNLDPGDPKLHFPLSAEAFGDPDAALTIQILTHRRRPLADRLEGSASIPIASLLNAIAASAGKIITLPLRRPSGRETGGWVRVSARVLWCLDGPAADFIVDGIPAIATGMPAAPDASVLGLFTAEPSAPPLPEDFCWVPADPAYEEAESATVETGASSLACTPSTQEDNCEDSSSVVVQSKVTATNDSEPQKKVTGGDDYGGDHGGGMSSFVVGFASGAAVLAGGLFIFFARRVQRR